MLPTLGEGVNGISVAPKSPDEIDVGDIVSFRRNDQIIVHRVVEKGVDAEGLYFVTKGDNSRADDGKVRFDEIERVLIGIVY
jgi:signal peptidase I